VKDLRKAARGRECQLRIPNICNHDNTTTVLAHIRRGGVAGMGQKPPDLCAVIACSRCHDAIDRRGQLPHGMTMGEIDGYILDALCRTLAIWTREGMI